MKLIYQGKFNGDIATLPHGEHQPGAVKFRECEDSRKLGILANGIAVGLMVLLLGTAYLRAGTVPFRLAGCLLALAAAFPHEILHAVCFREEVYLYTNWKEGMLFVVGPETMSRGRFIFMSLLPNLVFGILPYVLFLIRPQWEVLGTLGVMATGMGAGDYYNVFNALTQMPKGARTYLYQFNSWWYFPQKAGE